MSSKVKNIKDILEEYAPLKLKQSYDNAGLVGGNEEAGIGRIILELSKSTYKYA